MVDIAVAEQVVICQCLGGYDRLTSSPDLSTAGRFLVVLPLKRLRRVLVAKMTKNHYIITICYIRTQHLNMHVMPARDYNLPYSKMLSSLPASLYDSSWENYGCFQAAKEKLFSPKAIDALALFMIRKQAAEIPDILRKPIQNTADLSKYIQEAKSAAWQHTFL